MEEFIENFHFIRPWWLLVMLLPLLFYAKFSEKAAVKSSWQKVCDKRLLDFLLIRSGSAQSRFISLTALIGFISAISAAAGPSWQKTEVPNLSLQNPVMLVLDVSSEMARQDLSPNRLVRAKYKIGDLLKLLKGRQAGLIIYTQEPFLITPITDDARLIDNLLPEITPEIMPLNGERLDRAISLAAEKLKNTGYANGNIVIFSGDGGTDFAAALKAAETAGINDFKVSVLATASKKSEQLELIAQKGKGIYSQISSGDQDVMKISSFMEQEQNQEFKEAENMRTIWLDYGVYLVVLPLLCCLYFFRRGILAVGFILLTLHNAQAGFFLTDNQEGQRAFNRGDYQTAAQKFQQPSWKASSLYKSGNYDAAYREFSKENTVEALYNQGNALAKSGKINEAIKKYENVLEQNPQHEDAKFNLDYLKKQQQQQNQQQSGGNGENNEERQENNAQQDSSQSEQNEQNAQDNQQGQQSSSQQQGSQDSREQESQDGNSKQNNEKQNVESPSEQQSSEGEKQQNESFRSGEEAREKLPEQQRQAPTAGKAADDDSNTYDERAQALEQQYRDIPEDPGGLLRAYIYKEYLKNRYKD